ncbi:MAG: response regulator transcription factor [Pirellulales bacterium]|jgi:two-component system OmpR family response regulator/two-component system copper resistance phosphate regulon response regulator CusR
MQIAIIEDDVVVARAIRTAAEEAGHQCSCFEDGQRASENAAILGSDVVVLDLMLPKRPGIEILQEARREGIRTPVIVLTALGTVPNKLEAFEAGADDYLVKPFSMDELMARVEAIHRRASHRPAMELSVGPLHLSLANKRVSVDDRLVELTPTEFSMLELLMRYQGQVVTRKMLCEHVWGFDWDGPTNVIEVHINRLRGKIDRGRAESLVRTIRGRGYALASD